MLYLTKTQNTLLLNIYNTCILSRSISESTQPTEPSPLHTRIRKGSKWRNKRNLQNRSNRNIVKCYSLKLALATNLYFVMYWQCLN